MVAIRGRVMKSRAYWYFVLVGIVVAACDSLGSGYTPQQITAIQQGTPVAAVLTAFPVTYPPTPVSNVGTGGVSNAAANAQATIDAATRIAGDATRIASDATRFSISATEVSISQTKDAMLFQQQVAAANVQLSAEQQMTNLRLTVAAKEAVMTMQAMDDQARIDAADAQSAEDQLALFRQVQEAEASKAAAQARFWNFFQYLVGLATLVLVGAVLYYFFVWRPQHAVRVVEVNGQQIPFVQTPQGYAPVITRMPAQLTASEEAAAPELPDSTIPATLPRMVELPEVQRDVLQVGVFETGTPIHLGMGFKGILVTGEPGSGKSTFLRQLVAQALQHNWLVYLADGEQITFQPHLWGPVAKSHTEVVEWLGWLKGDIIEARHDLFRRVSEEIENRLHPSQQFLVEDLPGYNRAAAMFGLPHMSPMIIGWDEANKTLGDKNVQVLFDDLAQSARKVGAELIVSGHDWRATQVPKGSSSYLPWRVAFRSEKTSSEVVLRGSAAAMHIPFDRKGLAYTIMQEWRGYTQGYFVPDARLIQMIRQMRPRHELPEAAAWSGYTVTHNRPTAIPSEVGQHELAEWMDENQAEVDAAILLATVRDNGAMRSRRQVALKVAKNDNSDGYTRGDAALKVLARQGHQWASDLLETDARYSSSHMLTS